MKPRLAFRSVAYAVIGFVCAGFGIWLVVTQHAAWWPLVSHPLEYAGEADDIIKAFREALGRNPTTMLELGSGGGNTASHLARYARMTLVELSPDMLAVSRLLVPSAEHLQGDMRDVRLNRTFDAVLIHDAIMYMTTEAELRQALVTAFVHCRPGGVALFVPDYVRETFVPGTDSGGNDGDGRAHERDVHLHGTQPKSWFPRRA